MGIMSPASRWPLSAPVLSLQAPPELHMLTPYSSHRLPSWSLCLPISSTQPGLPSAPQDSLSPRSPAWDILGSASRGYLWALLVSHLSWPCQAEALLQKPFWAGTLEAHRMLLTLLVLQDSALKSWSCPDSCPTWPSHLLPWTLPVSCHPFSLSLTYSSGSVLSSEPYLLLYYSYLDISQVS